MMYYISYWLAWFLIAYSAEDSSAMMETELKEILSLYHNNNASSDRVFVVWGIYNAVSGGLYCGVTQGEGNLLYYSREDESSLIIVCGFWRD